MKLNFLSLIALAIGAILVPVNTKAGIVVTDAGVGGAATGSQHVNFDDLPLGSVGGAAFSQDNPLSGILVSFTPAAQAVTGSSSGLYAPPYASDQNADGFNSPTVPGADDSIYLTTGGEAGHTVTLQFFSQQSYLGMLWGSVDNYNRLEFYDGATLIGTIFGTDVWASANGDQGENGTFYVNMNTTEGSTFNRVVAVSTNFAFEFDNVAYNNASGGPLAPVPEPATMAIWGLGLGIAGLVRLRRKK